MINVTIATKNFRFLYTLNDALSNIEEIKTNHILPNETITSQTDLIITTETEKKLIQTDRIFIPKAFNRYYLLSNIILLVNNRQSFEEVVIGIDPGETTGIAILADQDIIIGTTEAFSAVDTVKEVISAFFNINASNFVIKIGKGGGKIHDAISKRLTDIFQDKLVIKIVGEEFTSKNHVQFEDKKLSKNMKSAVLIALREK